MSVPDIQSYLEYPHKSLRAHNWVDMIKSHFLFRVAMHITIILKRDILGNHAAIETLIEKLRATPGIFRVNTDMQAKGLIGATIDSTSVARSIVLIDHVDTVRAEGVKQGD